MNKLILLALIGATFSLSAQRSITLDSAWITNSGGVFFENKLVQYSTGESSLNVTALGDTGTVFQNYLDNFRSQARSWATDIEGTSDIGRKLKELIRQNAPIKSLIGKSPLDTMLRKTGVAQLVGANWRVKVNGGAALPVNFTVSAQGVLRYKVDTFQTRTANYVEHCMRLNNFQNTGRDADVFLFRNGRWYNADKSIQLYLQTAGPANRSEPDIAPFAQPVAVPVLYEGGLVLHDNKWWKYNATKKAWIPAKSPKTPKPARL